MLRNHEHHFGTSGDDPYSSLALAGDARRVRLSLPLSWLLRAGWLRAPRALLHRVFRLARYTERGNALTPFRAQEFTNKQRPSNTAQHARREAEAGEAFLEFRLDFLSSPCKGAEVIARFLEQFPDCTVLATCRRHQTISVWAG